jgi:hypothetical protein
MLNSYTYANTEGFQKYINEILVSLQRKVILPDMELLFNMGDWPQAPRHTSSSNGADTSSSSSTSTSETSTSNINRNSGSSTSDIGAKVGKGLSPVPVFSWCGSPDHYDMVLPTYKFVQASVFGKGAENVQEVDGTSYTVGGDWNSKKEEVYFRGRPSNQVRTDAHARNALMVMFT